MRKLKTYEYYQVSGAKKSSQHTSDSALAEDMLELMATSSKKNLAVNKLIRAFNEIFGTKVKYL